jgi:hypothetical protein
MAKQEDYDPNTTEIKSWLKVAKYSFFTMEIIICAIWIVAVKMLSTRLKQKYQQTNLNITKFFTHSFVFTL